jgi:hypothetical protein
MEFRQRRRYAYQPSFILKPLVTATTLAYFLLHDDLLPLPVAAETIGSESPIVDDGNCADEEM